MKTSIFIALLIVTHDSADQLLRFSPSYCTNHFTYSIHVTLHAAFLKLDLRFHDILLFFQMAGGEGGRSAADYPYDESKYKGFWRYYNNETPRGRAGVSIRLCD